MIKIAYFTVEDIAFPCPVLRVLAPARALGPNVVVAPAVCAIHGKKYENPSALTSADVVLVQRGFPRNVTEQICEVILSTGKPVIYEIDDALEHVPEHQRKPMYTLDVAPAIREFASRASLVTVSTKPLAGLFSRHAKRIRVLPNYLTADLWSDDLAPRAHGDRVRIGFLGSFSHRRNVELLLPLLKEMLARFPHVDVVLYGNALELAEPKDRFIMLPPMYDYASHPRRLAEAGIDIAIAPLEEGQFNRCKSNIKFLEFGFLGTPGLYADLEPYRDSVVHGETGFLCGADLESWRNALFALIEDGALRERMGRAAREVVRGRWMFHQHKEEWLEAWTAH